MRHVLYRCALPDAPVNVQTLFRYKSLVNIANSSVTNVVLWWAKVQFMPLKVQFKLFFTKKTGFQFGKFSKANRFCFAQCTF